MKAVVTGGTGFIGKQLVHELLRYNIDVIILRKEDSAIPAQFQGKVSVVTCPLNALSNIEPNDITKDDVDLFFHFGWIGASGERRSDVNIQLRNIEYACDAVRLAAKMHSKRFINAGSIVEYEVLKDIPSDNAKPNINHVYSIAKLSADLMAKTIATNLSLPYIDVIISNVYGAGETSKRFVNTILREMINHKSIDLTHGQQLYDFIYISDAAKAIVVAALHGIANNSYYIGNTQQYPLKEFVLQMKEVTGSASPLHFGAIPLKSDSLTYKEFDTCRLYREFGFKPEVTFEQGVMLLKAFIENEEQYE